MKKIIYFFIIICFAISCEIDNYDAPETVLSGNIVYNGENIQVMGTDGTVQLELYQPGYDLTNSPITVYVAQDGSFQTKLFNGNYKLVATDGTGPWVSSHDTVKVVVSGNTTCEYQVTPYYTISDESFSLSGSTLTATFTINYVAGSSDPAQAMLLVNNTAFVDEIVYMERTEIDSPGIGQVTMTIDLSDETLSSVLVNARIGVKIEGEQAIYSSVQQIK
jgi:hypothetical protein